MSPAALAIEPEDYRQQVALKWIVLTVLGVAVFLNGLLGTFVGDDLRLIVNTPDIRSLSMSSQAWLSPHRAASWTLAINYALGGDKAWGYHLVNVLLHTLSGLVLFGLTCRTLLLQSERPRLQELAPWIALIVALLWMIHPLQSPSATYISSRSDLIAGLCFLLTLYGTLRSAERPGELSTYVWYGVAILACAVGMGEAPYMVCAPVTALLYDRVYLTGSFADSLRRRWGLYAALAVCWVLLFLPLLGNAPVAGRNTWEYLNAQPLVLVHYLRLTIWPYGQCVDYSDWAGTAPSGALPSGEAVALLLLLAAALFTLVRWPKVGYPAIFFWLTLAPSSVWPAADLVREPRMYLPLAGVSVLVVLGGLALTRLIRGRVAIPEAAGLLIAVPLLAVLGYFCFQRNTVYFSGEEFWADAVAKRPQNVHARMNLAGALFQTGKYEQSAQEYRQVKEKSSGEMQEAAQRNLGIALGMSGDVGQAIATLRSAWPTDPERGSALNSLGVLLLNKKDYVGAERCFQESLKCEAGKAEYHFNLAVALKEQGKNAEAETAKQAGLKLDPDFLKGRKSGS